MLTLASRLPSKIRGKIKEKNDYALVYQSGKFKNLNWGSHNKHVYIKLNTEVT